MAWIMDTFSMNKGYPVMGVVTGKPISLGGSLGRNEATGRGCYYTVLSSCQHLNIPVKGARVVVQGFGNAGSIAAHLLHSAQAVVIGASDSPRRHLQPQWPGHPQAHRAQGAHRTLRGFPEAEHLARRAVRAGLRDPRPGGPGERHHRGKRLRRRPESSPRPPTVRSPPKPTASSTRRASSSSRTSSAMPAE